MASKFKSRIADPDEEPIHHPRPHRLAIQYTIARGAAWDSEVGPQRQGHHHRRRASPSDRLRWMTDHLEKGCNVDERE